MAHDEDPVDELRSVGMTSAAALSRVAETMIRAAQDHKMRSAQQAAQEAEEGQRRYDAQAQVAERFYREAIDQDLMTTPPRADQDTLRQGALQWAELDPDRFGPYSERLNARREELDQEATRREEASQEQRTAEEQESKARREDGPEKAEEHRQASAADVAGGDEATNEADRHGQVTDEIETEGPAYDSAERREETAKETKEAGVPEPQREAKLTADHLNAKHPKTAARGGQGRQKAAAKGRSVEQTKKRTKTLGRGR
jgi:hypothetical protein